MVLYVSKDKIFNQSNVNICRRQNCQDIEAQIIKKMDFHGVLKWDWVKTSQTKNNSIKQNLSSKVHEVISDKKGTYDCVNENSGEGFASFVDGNKSIILLQGKNVNLTYNYSYYYLKFISVVPWMKLLRWTNCYQLRKKDLWNGIILKSKWVVIINNWKKEIYINQYK